MDCLNQNTFTVYADFFLLAIDYDSSANLSDADHPKHVKANLIELWVLLWNDIITNDKNPTIFCEQEYWGKIIIVKSDEEKNAQLKNDS